MIGLTRRRRTGTRPLTALAVVALAVFLCGPLHSEDASGKPRERDPIRISANLAQTWQDGDTTVLLLRGRCEVQQAHTVLSARQMVIWRRTEARGRQRLTVFLEEEARLDEPGRTLSENSLIFDLLTRAEVSEPTATPIPAAQDDPLYQRAAARRKLVQPAKPMPIQQAQFIAPSPVDAEPVPDLQSLQPAIPTSGLRRIRVFPRSAVRFNVESFESNATTPPEQVWIFTGGIMLLIDGIDSVQGAVDLSADRVVIWTQLADQADFTGEGTIQARDVPFQVYLEGNIVARQGTNTIRASQAYYDARSEKGLMYNAELKAEVPNFPGKVRLRAEQIRQVARNTFQAHQAFITTSQFGAPGYRLQADDILLEPRPYSWFGRNNPARVNPETGIVESDTTLWATTLDNRFYLGNVPLFYTPYATFPAEDPNIPLRRITFQSDDIFGPRLDTAWDLYKLFGLEPIDGTQVNLHLDYMHKRGPQIGLSGQYEGADRYLFQGPYHGIFEGFYTRDWGEDNLGQDRLNLEPDSKNRGRLLMRDRQYLPWNMTYTGETGYLSDRNYLEQYNEGQYDAGKDYESVMHLKQDLDNWSWSAMGRFRQNDFFNQSAWLPRADLYGLSEPLFGTPITWTNHSYAGYGNVRVAEAPSDPRDLFSVLPFEGNADGMVAMTRHQIDVPFSLGPVRVVPYAMGELTHWQEDYTGSELDRAYGSAGARASLEFTRIFREVQSELFYLNGLAHKMVFDVDYSLSDSSQSLGGVPIYNEFDDNAQEQYRRRLLSNTFGGVLPAQFDPRSLALRSGTAQSVTAPYHELVDDLHVARFGWRHRLQTKRGPMNAQRIVNWMTLDLETSLFPDADRDNFGEDLGLYGARYTWNVGEKTTLLASTYFDTFDDGMQIWNVGVNSQRSARGSVYVGLRSIAGATLDSQILSASYTYQLSPKWVTTMGTAYDLRERQNRGQSFTLSRIGADFIVHVGAVVDPNKDNFGVAFSIEPRFAPFSGAGTQLSSLLNTTAR